MATFTIKRGDSMPPVEIALREVGSDPTKYWDVAKDDVGAGGATAEENAGIPPTGYEVHFIMRSLKNGKLVAPGANATYTGFGEVYNKTDPATQITQTILRYNWTPPDSGYDLSKDPSKQTSYGGDTLLAGSYAAEFEVLYPSKTIGTPPNQKTVRYKRTFPSGADTLIINVVEDENDRAFGENPYVGGST